MLLADSMTWPEAVVASVVVISFMAGITTMVCWTIYYDGDPRKPLAAKRGDQPEDKAPDVR